MSLLQLAQAQVEMEYFTMPGDTHTYVQYNYNGEFKGASNVIIKDSTLVLPNIASSVSSTEVGSKIYGEQIASRGFIKNLDAFGSHVNQPFIANRTISMAIPLGDGSTTVNTWGWSNATTGTATARSITAGNNFTQRRRIGYVTAAATNSNAYYGSLVGQCYISSGTGLGGFYFSVGFGISDATFQDSSRLSVGLASTLPWGSADPSTKTNCIYIGSDALDTLLYIMHNDGSGSCTKVSLGSDFTKTTSNTTWYKFSLYNPQNTQVVYYEVMNCTTRTKVTGSINSNIPSTSTVIYGHVGRNSGQQNQAVGIDFNNLYLETEY